MLCTLLFVLSTQLISAQSFASEVDGLQVLSSTPHKTGSFKSASSYASSFTLTPNFGVAEGNTPVTFTLDGTVPPDSKNVYCRFGKHVARAHYFSYVAAKSQPKCRADRRRAPRERQSGASSR